MLLTIAILNLAVFITLVVLARRIKIALNASRKAINEYITPKSNDEPSPLEVQADRIAFLFNERLKASIKGSLMGSISGVRRNEKALERELASEAIKGESPAAGDIFDLLPKKWQDKVIENPSLAQAAMNLLTKGMSPGQNPQPGGNGHNNYGEQVARWNR